MKRDDRIENASKLPPYIEQTMLEILDRPSASTSALRREEALRALFVALAPRHAHDLFRRFDAGDDPLAHALRRFLRRRR